MTRFHFANRIHKRSICHLLLAIVICQCWLAKVQAAETDFDHSAWATVLTHFVDQHGYVDYQGLNNQRESLDAYLALIRKVGPASRPELFPTRNHQLAYYINAYNALVFEGVLGRGPESKSVWRGLISGLNFFVRMDVRLDGMTTNLRNLEDDVIRDGYRDPRIHAALNCASVSCPRLPQHPFDAGNLDQQLDAAMYEFVASENNVRVDSSANTVYLSEVFDWFDEDFIDFEKQAGNSDPSLVDYINRYRTTNQEIPGDLRVRFIPYDKGINSQPH